MIQFTYVTTVINKKILEKNIKNDQVKAMVLKYFGNLERGEITMEN